MVRLLSGQPCGIDAECLDHMQWGFVTTCLPNLLMSEANPLLLMALTGTMHVRVCLSDL